MFDLDSASLLLILCRPASPHRRGSFWSSVFSPSSVARDCTERVQRPLTALAPPGAEQAVFSLQPNASDTRGEPWGLLEYLLDWLRRCAWHFALSRARLTHAARLHSLFFKEEMELSLIGLNAAGKTSLVNVIAVRPCSAATCTWAAAFAFGPL